MKKVVAISLLLAASYAIKCRKQTPSWKVALKSNFATAKIGFGGISWDSQKDCGIVAAAVPNYQCATSKFEGEYGNTAGITMEYESIKKHCSLKKICTEITGGESGCKYVEYSLDTWIPTSCQAPNYGAFESTKTVKMTLDCCGPDDLCNTADPTWANCEKNEAYGGYMEAINTCWNVAKKDFMTTLLCDDDGITDIISFSDECKEDDGSWKTGARALARCAYKSTCAPEARAAILSFGECACKAASDNGKSGAVIGTAWEASWMRFCPGIDISCADDGTVALLQRIYNIRYRLIITLDLEAAKAKWDEIKAKIAEKLNIEVGELTVEFTTHTVNSGNTRRLLADMTDVNINIPAEDKATADYFHNALDATLASDIGTLIGAITSQDGETATEESDYSSTGHTESGAVVQSVHMVSLVVMLMAIATFMA